MNSVDTSITGNIILDSQMPMKGSTFLRLLNRYSIKNKLKKQEVSLAIHTFSMFELQTRTYWSHFKKNVKVIVNHAARPRMDLSTLYTYLQILGVEGN